MQEHVSNGMIKELLGVALLVFLAKALEEAIVRKRGPPLVGWALAGIMLGPALFCAVEPSPGILFLASIGVYLFFFTLGLEEVDLEGIASSLSARYALAPALATLLVIVGTYLAGTYLGLASAEAFSLAVLAALPTASVVAKTLSDLGQLKTGVGVATFSYVLIGEVLGLLLAGALLELGGTEIEPRAILVQLGEVALFFAVAGAASVFLVPRLVKAARLYMISRGAQVGIVFGLLLLFVGIGEMLGVHGVVGALILGLALSDALLEESSRQALDALKKLGDGVFVPLFFAAMGLRFEWSFLFQDPLLVLVVPLLLVPYRVATHYAVLKALRVRYAKEISTSLLARGAVDLAVLAALSERGLLSTSIYSLVVAVSIISLLGYPMVAKKIFARAPVEGEEPPMLMPVIAKYILGLIRVRDVMEEAVVFSPDTPVEDAAKVLEEVDLEWGVVVDSSGALAGLVAQQDLEGAKGRVSDYLKRPRLVAKPSERLYAVLREMSLMRQRAVPVVNEDGEVVGIVTVHSVLKALVAK